MVGLVAFALIAAGCGGAGEEADSEGGSSSGESASTQELTVATTVHLTDVDPTLSVSASDPTYLWTIYDSLLDFDPETLEPQPGLATEWEWTDDTTVVIGLRDDVTFHDGSPFDADAVKWNLERVKADDSSIRAELGMLESVDVVDPHTVQLNLSAPNASILTTLSQRAGMMVAPSALDSGSFEAIGTGPFELEDFAREDRLVVTKNDSYWQPNEPKLDRLEIVGIPNTGSLISAFNGGDIDAFVTVPAAESEGLDPDAGIVETHTIQYYRKVYLNVGAAPLDDVRVRQAMNHAVDREAMMAALLPDPELGEVAWMPMPAGHFAHTAELAEAYPYDPDKARALLADAGYADGLELSMIVESVPANQQRAEMIQQFFAEVGIDLELQVMETIAGAELFMAGDGLMFNSQWAGRPDPDMTFRTQFYTGGIFMPGEWERADELNAAIDAGAAPQTFQGRSEAYVALNTLIVENALEIPLFFEPFMWAWDDDVTGMQLQATNTAKFHDVSIDAG